MKVYIVFIFLFLKCTFIFCQEIVNNINKFNNNVNKLQNQIDLIKYRIDTLESMLPYEKKDKNVIHILKYISLNKDSIILILTDSVNALHNSDFANYIKFLLEKDTVVFSKSINLPKEPNDYVPKSLVSHFNLIKIIRELNENLFQLEVDIGDFENGNYTKKDESEFKKGIISKFDNANLLIDSIENYDKSVLSTNQIVFYNTNIINKFNAIIERLPIDE